MIAPDFTRRYADSRTDRKAAFLALVLLGLTCGGCQVFRHVPESRYLIEDQDVVVEPGEEDTPVRDLEVQLSNLVTNPPNTRVLGMFRTYLWFHYRLQKPGKETRTRRFLRENLSEPPVYLDEGVLANNLEGMLIFLKNRGYFQCRGEYEVTLSGKKPLARVTYRISTGRPLRIKSMEIRSPDPEMAQWLPVLNRQTTLKPGMIIQGDTYSREVARITDFLRNRGYAFFFPNQITALQVDVADTSRYEVPVFLEILPPADGRATQAVRIGDVVIQTAEGPNQPIILDTVYRGIRIRDARPEGFVQPDILYRALDVRPDSLYAESQYVRTNRRLSLLGIYRFVNTRTREDSLTGRVNMDIQLTPSYRMADNYSFDVNNTTAIGDNSNVLGLSFNAGRTYQNLFRRAIRMEANLQPSIEANIAPLQFNAINAGASVRMQFPFFEDYFRVWKHSRLRRWYPWLWQDARSYAGASYTYNNLLNFWETHFMNVQYGFDYNPKPNLRVSLDHFQIDYYQNALLAGFRDNAPPGSELAFQSQFLTGFLFRAIKGNYQSLPNRYGESWSFRGGFEQSGLEILALNSVYRIFKPDTAPWTAGDISFSKYLRGDGQWTYSRNFGKGRTAATRLYTGLIIPLADTRTSPYIKQFSAGGPSSMRGWLNGQLGPGGTPPTRTSPPYFQRGDLKLEINAEWRQKIFWLLEGAVFLDAGNIWNLREDPDLPDAGLRNMHQEWALSGGMGIRLNFQFFILVYDVGAKIRYPYEVNGSHWARRLDLNFQNLLINYPF